jgi:hypothetical protein
MIIGTGFEGYIQYGVVTEKFFRYKIREFKRRFWFHF